MQFHRPTSWLIKACLCGAVALIPALTLADASTNAPPNPAPVAAPAPPAAPAPATPAQVVAPLPPSIAAAVSPVAVPPPKVLSMEMSIIRFKPATNQPVYQDYKLYGPLSAILETLRSAGRSADLLYHGTREVVLEAKSDAKFSATETRPVVLLGKQGTPPPAIVYGLVMDVAARPVAGDAFVLLWDGTLNWSPDLIDRRATGPDAVQLLDKAAGAAKAVSAVTGNSAAGEIGLAVADLFHSDAASDSAIYELPVLKTVALGGSRVCHSGETIVNSTSAEAGSKEPQVIFFVLTSVVE